MQLFFGQASLLICKFRKERLKYVLYFYYSFLKAHTSRSPKRKKTFKLLKVKTKQVMPSAFYVPVSLPQWWLLRKESGMQKQTWSKSSDN